MLTSHDVLELMNEANARAKGGKDREILTGGDLAEVVLPDVEDDARRALVMSAHQALEFLAPPNRYSIDLDGEQGFFITSAILIGIMVGRILGPQQEGEA